MQTHHPLHVRDIREIKWVRQTYFNKITNKILFELVSSNDEELSDFNVFHFVRGEIFIGILIKF